MSESEKVIVPGWMTRVVPVLVAIVMGTIGFMAWGDARYVRRDEWDRVENNVTKEARETQNALEQHIRDTRLDAARLGVIEAQLQAIREDLAWFKHRIEKDKQK